MARADGEDDARGSISLDALACAFFIYDGAPAEALTLSVTVASLDTRSCPGITAEARGEGAGTPAVALPGRTPRRINP